jgi:CrcB protein
MLEVLYVGFGGFLGASFRFGIGRLMKIWLDHPFPWATLAVNIVGCICLGFMVGLFKNHASFSTLWLFLVIGFLGSFTTFSAFSFETVELLQQQELRLAMLNIAANVIFCLGAILSGILAGNYIK